jgi:hypothetical protein
VKKWLLVTANVISSSPILVTLMNVALRSSETSILTRAKQRNIPEDNILHGHTRGNLNSFVIYIGTTIIELKLYYNCSRKKL